METITWDAKRMERFWSYIRVDGGGCWEWKGFRNQKGYGMFAVGSRVTRLAHRLMYEIAFKKEPTGRSVCHHCDNPPCVKPTHIYLGTPKSNSSDMWTRRPPNRKGACNGRAKISEALVIAIRSEYRFSKTGVKGSGYPALAKKYGIPRATAYNIVSRKTWSHI